MITNLSFKYRRYADLANSDTWVKYLKPDLLKIINEVSLNEREPEKAFESVKSDLKRLNTIKVINQIIALIEKSENKIKSNSLTHKPYAKQVSSNDDSGDES